MKTTDNPEFRGLPNTTMNKEKINHDSYIEGFKHGIQAERDGITKDVKLETDEMRLKRIVEERIKDLPSNLIKQKQII